MANDIDELQIQIQASAKGANSSVTALTKRLEKLSNVINGIDAKKVNNLGIGLNNVGRGGNTASVGLNKTSASAKKAATSFNGLASAFGKFYATYFLFIRGAKSVWKGIESSMDYVETSNYFSVALGEIGKQFESAGYESAELYTEALSSELNKLNEKLTGYSVGSKGEALFSGTVGLGMDIEQMMNFQAKTLAVTNSVGLMGDASIETAKAVSMLAGDISSLTNTDLETVMTNLSSGLIGQSRSLYKYGYDITQNTLQQYALAEGIDEAVSEMTQAEKMQLRLIAILDQADVSTADLANTVNSVANQYRIFGQQIDNTGRTLGNLFLPIVKNVLPWVNGLIIAINNLLTSLGFQIYGDTWLEDLQDGISGGVQEDFEDFEGSVDDATDSVEKFKKSVRGFDELNVLTGGTSVGSGVLGELEGQIDLTDRIADAVADYESAWDEAFANAENKANTFAETLTKMFEETGAVENFVEIVDSIKEFNKAISPFAEGFGEGFFNSLKEISEVSLNTFNTSLKFFGNILNEIEPESLDKLGTSIGSFTGALTGFIIAETIGSKIAKSIETIISAISAHPLIAAAGALTTFTVGLINYSNALEDAFEEDALLKAENLRLQLDELDGVFSNFSGTMDEITAKEKGVSEALNSYFELLQNENIDFDSKKSSLQGYVNYITKQFPETAKYVDEHTGLFTANKDEILANIDAVTKYAKAVAAQNVLTDAYKEYYESLAEYRKLYEEYDRQYEEYHKNYDGSLLPFAQSKEQKKAYEEMGKAYRAYIAYQEKMLASQEKIKEMEDIANSISESYNALSGDNKKATESTVNLAQETQNFVKIADAANKGTLPNLAENLNTTSGAFEKAIDMTKKLGIEIDNLSNKKINIPVSIGGSGSSGLNFKNLLSPNASIKAYAGGGLVTAGEVFVARENGIPEMVGSFGNRTAVANNDQIVSGIQAGVYSAMVSALATMGRTSNGDIIINMDGREVFRVVQARANEHFRTTGNPAFDF